MFSLITAGLISLLMGVAILVKGQREVSRRIGAFWDEHTVYEGEGRPEVQIRKIGKGTLFLNVGATGKFQPPEGFVSMERTIEEIRKELSWLNWLGISFVGLGLFLLIASIL